MHQKIVLKEWAYLLSAGLYPSCLPILTKVIFDTNKLDVLKYHVVFDVVL